MMSETSQSSWVACRVHRKSFDPVRCQNHPSSKQPKKVLIWRKIAASMHQSWCQCSMSTGMITWYHISHHHYFCSIFPRPGPFGRWILRGCTMIIYHIIFGIIKGSWEAILPSYGQIEFWDLKWWRVVCHLTIHNKRIRAMQLTLMKGGRSHNNT